MDFLNALICVAFSTLVSCYAWGMRGALIGGEKGAMLPGAFIGTVLAWFAGGEIRESFWIVSAAGLMGMSFGGIETYGETIGMVLHRGRSDYRPIKGYSGLAVKGALWFSICGGFIAMSISAMGGKYSVFDIVVFCLLIPAMQQVGYAIFNKPYDKEKGIHPKVYYSVTRREEWGSNLTVLLAMMLTAIIKNDTLMLTMISSGLVSGGIGWIVAMRAYECSVFQMKNGKYLFNKLYAKGIFDGWKLMEFILGAFGGLGIAVGFCSQYEIIKVYNNSIAENGRFSPLADYESIMYAVAALLALAVLAVNVYQFACEKAGKKVNYYICDQIERPLYNVIPMLLVLLGSLAVSRIMTVFMLVLVCIIKCVFDRFAEAKSIYVFQIISIALCGGVFAGDILLGGYKPIVIMLAGTVPYLVAEFICAVYESRKKQIAVKETITKTAFATVYTCFAVMSIVVLIVSYKIFRF